VTYPTKKPCTSAAEFGQGECPRVILKKGSLGSYFTCHTPKTIKPCRITRQKKRKFTIAKTWQNFPKPEAKWAMKSESKSDDTALAMNDLPQTITPTEAVRVSDKSQARNPLW